MVEISFEFVAILKPLIHKHNMSMYQTPRPTQAVTRKQKTMTDLTASAPCENATASLLVHQTGATYAQMEGRPPVRQSMEMQREPRTATSEITLPARNPRSLYETETFITLSVDGASAEFKHHAKDLTKKQFWKMYYDAVWSRASDEEKDHVNVVKAAMTLAVQNLIFTVTVPWPAVLKPTVDHYKSSERWVELLLKHSSGIVLRSTTYDTLQCPSRCCCLRIRHEQHIPGKCVPYAKVWQLTGPVKPTCV